MGNEIVFDIETQNSFADTNNDTRGLRVSAVVIYEYATGTFRSFTEDTLSDLWPILEKAERLIGYNSLHFDVPVLQNYYSGNLLRVPHLDMLAVIKETLGFRLKLNDVAQATINAEKSADGLQAIAWWKQGDMEKIIRYCTDDVRITRDVYEYGLANKQLLYKRVDGTVVPFPVQFAPAPTSAAAGETRGINLSLPL